MRLILCTATVLHLLALVNAAAIYASGSLSSGFPSVNQSLIEETLHYLDSHEASTKRDAMLHTFRPWPPPPFNFRSTTKPSSILRINSYDDHLLTFRQMHAMVSLCYETIELLKILDPDTPMLSKTYIFRATKREPYDLTREDVEVAFFNSAGEAGNVYTAFDMATALDIMLGRMLPQQLPDIARTVLHYATTELRDGSKRYRRIEIRRKTNEPIVAAATA